VAAVSVCEHELNAPKPSLDEWGDQPFGERDVQKPAARSRLDRQMQLSARVETIALGSPLEPERCGFPVRIATLV
jgi:hypothetical protein